ncbi:MAG TPA: TatD family hydrolase, partial [Balneolales bacterium]|nr:TatD family hydrolase [Balneolales bacterium]
YQLFMIDTHCHLFVHQFDEDRTEAIERAAKAGVTDIVMPAIDLQSPEQMKGITHSSIRFYQTVGIHPTEIKELHGNLETQLGELAAESRFYAIGETGLDYYWSKEHVEEQKQSLRIHCRVSRTAHKPIILHNRNSTNDLLNLIEEEQNGELTGVWHCFTGTLDEGKRAIDLGLLLGVGGVSTFKNAGVDKVLKELPIEKMILETDAPWLAPTPKRGKRNEPAFVRYTGEKLAENLRISFDDMDEITSRNARGLFQLF